MQHFESHRIDEDGKPLQEGTAVHAFNETSAALFTFSRAENDWMRNSIVEDHFFFPELHTDGTRIVFKAISQDRAYGLTAQTPQHLLAAQ